MIHARSPKPKAAGAVTKHLLAASLQSKATSASRYAPTVAWGLLWIGTPSARSVTDSTAPYLPYALATAYFEHRSRGTSQSITLPAADAGRGGISLSWITHVPSAEAYSVAITSSPCLKTSSSATVRGFWGKDA